MNYEERLNEIAYSAGVCFDYKKVFGYSLFERIKIKTFVRKIVRRVLLSNNGKLIMLGGEKDINYWKRRVKNSGVDFIADSDIFVSFWENVPIYKTVEQINNTNVKAVLVVTRRGRRAVESMLLQNGFLCYDLFDELNFTYGIDYFREIYDDNLCRDIKELIFGILYRVNCRMIPTRYENIIRYIEQNNRKIDGYVDICAYKQMMEKHNEKEYLRKLIRAYYQIKDFDLLNEYIVKYIKLYDDDYSEKFKNYLTAQNTILLEMQVKLKKRKQKDIVLRWIDATPKADLDKYNLFEYARKNAYEFTKTYSETPYTHPVEKAIMTGGKLIEDGLYDLKLNHDNALEKYLASQGYRTKIFSHVLNMGDISVMDTLYFEDFEYQADFYPNSIINWFMQLAILESEKPIFCLAHTIAETHNPWLTPVMKVIDLPNDSMTYDVIEEKRREGLIYINKKLERYDSLLSDKTVFIYMSDHGYPNYKSTIAQYSENEIHAFCFLYGNGINSGKNEKYFQHREMKTAITAIIEGDLGAMDNIGNEYATIQGEDVYSENKIKNVLKRLNESEKFEASNLMQFRGVVTDTAKYIRHPFIEKYFEEPGDMERELEEIDGKEVEYLREIAGDQMIDIKTNEKYRYSRMLYERLGYKIDN